MCYNNKKNIYLFSDQHIWGLDLLHVSVSNATMIKHSLNKQHNDLVKIETLIFNQKQRKKAKRFTTRRQFNCGIDTLQEWIK